MLDKLLLFYFLLDNNNPDGIFDAKIKPDLVWEVLM